MLRSTLLLLLLAVVPQQGPVQSSRVGAKDVAAADRPIYTASGELKMPERYREWIFLTSGVDMSYSPNAAMAGHSMFDNVFVNPSAYRVFQKTGTWPDETTLVLEVRGAEGASSINKRGHTQSPEIMGMEVHVKDAKLEGGWGFYEFDGPGSAKIVKRPASCYECHESHAAVDTTFVQYYPTLIGLAKAKGTLSAAYLKEMSAPAESK
jgi:Cytochrome P460